MGEDEEEEEDGDGMLQDERVSPSAAVGAIDTLMRYFEQCQLTMPDDIEHLSQLSAAWTIRAWPLRNNHPFGITLSRDMIN